MSLKPQPIPEIPAETVRVVRAVFPKGNIYIHLRDMLGTIYQDELFADLYPDRGQPAYAPWRLALVSVFQFMENLTDRQAADAVRSRLDWKYALSLELTDPGFDHTVLSEFRTRLVALTAEERFLDAVLALCKEHGWRHPHVGINGLTRPTSWPRFARSIEQNAWSKRSGMPSMSWLLSPLTGCADGCSQTG
jgi:transposase